MRCIVHVNETKHTESENLTQLCLCIVAVFHLSFWILIWNFRLVNVMVERAEPNHVANVSNGKGI